MQVDSAAVALKKSPFNKELTKDVILLPTTRQTPLALACTIRRMLRYSLDFPRFVERALVLIQHAAHWRRLNPDGSPLNSASSAYFIISRSVVILPLAVNILQCPFTQK
jgi:hypothetical protein